MSESGISGLGVKTVVDSSPYCSLGFTHLGMSCCCLFCFFEKRHAQCAYTICQKMSCVRKEEHCNVCNNVAATDIVVKPLVTPSPWYTDLPSIACRKGTCIWKQNTPATYHVRKKTGTCLHQTNGSAFSDHGSPFARRRSRRIMDRCVSAY